MKNLDQQTNRSGTSFYWNTQRTQTNECPVEESLLFLLKWNSGWARIDSVLASQQPFTAVMRNRVLFFFQYFTGNRDQNTVVQHRFYPPIKARFIQVRPWGWYGHISMRVEFYGCTEGAIFFNYFCLGFDTFLVGSGPGAFGDQFYSFTGSMNDIHFNLS